MSVLLHHRWCTNNQTIRNDGITKKSKHINIEPRLTGITDIDPAKLPEFPSATMIRLSIGESSNLELFSDLSGITAGIAPESNKPWRASEYTANSTTRCRFGVMSLHHLRQ